MKDLGKRPRCPECGGLPISNGITWYCTKDGNSWVKIKRGGNYKDLGVRPLCPRCGTENPTSDGKSWRCKSCGKKWLKVSIYKKKGLEDRPPCPFCGTENPNSDGMRWRCTKCYRTWSKNYLRERLVNIIDIVNTKVTEI